MAGIEVAYAAALRGGPFALDGIDDEVLHGVEDLEVEVRSASGRVKRVGW